MAITSSSRKRIDVRLPPSVSAKQERELVAFARYCVQRIEKELGQSHEWGIEVELRNREYLAFVAVQHLAETRGTGSDGPLAIWDAMCRIEQELRERSATPVKPAND